MLTIFLHQCKRAKEKDFKGLVQEHRRCGVVIGNNDIGDAFERLI